MTAHAPRWALAAQAIDSHVDPTLAPGVHLRVLPAFEFGLPIAPLAVWRVDLGPDARDATLREDIVWRDSAGNELTPPFNVSPGDRITGRLPSSASGICCWAHVIASAGAALKVQAALVTARGPATVVADSTAPYQVSASHIEHLILSGSGVVEGVRWLDARTVQPAGYPWRFLALPIPGGARYYGVGAGAAASAQARADRGAPRRFGLHDEPNVVNAAAASASTVNDERSRLAALKPSVLQWLLKLLNDLSATQQQLTDPTTLTDPQGRSLGTLSPGCLGAVLQASLDPGMGRWLGFVDVDEAPPTSTEGHVIAYVIRGLWELQRDLLGPRTDGLPQEAFLEDPREGFVYKRQTDDDYPRPDRQEPPEKERPPEKNGPCDSFEDLEPESVMGPTMTRGGTLYESLVPGFDLRTTDWMPARAPDGLPEVAFPEKGMRITLANESDRVTATVAQFTGSDIVMEAYDVTGARVGRDRVGGPQGTELFLEIAAPRIVEVVLYGGGNEGILMEFCQGRGEPGDNCFGWEDEEPKSELGPVTTRDDVRYESIDPRRSLELVDWWPPGGDGRAELRIPETGLKITLPRPASSVTAHIVEFAGAPVRLLALDEAGNKIAVTGSSGATGTEEILTVNAHGIAELILRGRAEAVLLKLCYTPEEDDRPEEPEPEEYPNPGEGLDGPFLDLCTVACATIKRPPDWAQPPVLGQPMNGPWMPASPPAAEREIVVPLSQLAPGASLAFARRDGANVTGLNPRSSAGRALPLLPSPPPGATSPGQGEVFDRNAPPQAVVYRAAQADWFGRWSGWRERAAGPGARPLPPRPIVTLDYTPPSYGSPVPTGPLSGVLHVTVPVPPVTSLAPGAYLLASLAVTVNGAVTTHAIPVPASPPENLRVNITGPAIARSGHADVLVQARWTDIGSQVGPLSEPITRRLYDPRPPEQVSLPSTLQYAARPDVTGMSRVELKWTPSAGQARYRVFYADETSLRARLGKIAAKVAAPGDTPEAAAAIAANRTRASAILTAINAATTAPDRAAVFVANADFLARDGFEQVTGTPIARPSSGQASFVHAVSGSLRVLSFYRVIAISGSNVETSFNASSLVPVGVPNTGPPPQPLIEVKPLAPTATTPSYRAQVTVRVPRGLVPAIEYRLRRSATTSADPLAMPLAASGPIPLPTGTGPQEIVVMDTGVSELSSTGTLKPWCTYHWRAEARGGPEPGGGPSGLWSTSSAPVSTSFIPKDPPVAVSGIAVAVSGGRTNVTWTHPDPLEGGELGGYRIDLYRRKPDEAEEFLTSLPASLPPAAAASAASGRANVGDSYRYSDATVPSGTTYRAIVVDPIGRTSPPSIEVTVP